MPSSVFINHSGELRSGWKFITYIVIFLLIWLITGILVGGAFRYTPLPFTFLVELGLNAIALFVPAVGAMLFMARVVERKPASQFVGFQNWKKDLLAGVLIGAALLLLVLLASAVTGVIHVERTDSPIAMVLITTAILALAAANEELVFRGYPMQALARGIGRWPAAAVMSGLFGLLHVGNPNASVIGIINTVLAGLMLSRAYFKARSLWLPYGIHVSWNVGLGVVLGFSLSGINLDSLWETAVDGSPAWVGGFYGPEGGILGTLAFLAGTVAVSLVRTPEPQDDK